MVKQNLVAPWGRHDTNSIERSKFSSQVSRHQNRSATARSSRVDTRLLTSPRGGSRLDFGTVESCASSAGHLDKIRKVLGSREFD